MQIVIDINEDTYRYMQSRCKYQNKDDKGLSKFEEAGVAIKNGTPLPKRYNVDTLLQKATDEVFVQCKQFNEKFSKDWNDGFNDGMFHTLTIIKEIIKADKGGE